MPERVGPGQADVRLAATWTIPQRRRLAALAAAVVGLHALGWGLVLAYAGGHPALLSVAVLAYTLGLRHAFDADHVCAIDNVTRRMLQAGRRPLGVGFAFSLGHATVVFALACAVAVAARAVDAALPRVQDAAGTLGGVVSGSFLLGIGVLNLFVLADVLRAARRLRGGDGPTPAGVGDLAAGGLLTRLLGRFFRLVDTTWKVYPLGLLFGLGFDTATEVGLLALTAGAASGAVPVGGILALPIVFAAGMTLLDSANGAVASKAYAWAFERPARRLYYNLTVTALSVAVALLVGAVELLQVAAERLGLDGAAWAWLLGLDFGSLGYLVAGLLAFAWIGAAAYWRLGRVEERWSPSRGSA